MRRDACLLAPTPFAASARLAEAATSMHDAFHRAHYDLVGIKEQFSKMKQDRKVLSRVFKLLLALAVNIRHEGSAYTAGLFSVCTPHLVCDSVYSVSNGLSEICKAATCSTHSGLLQLL